MNTTPNHLFAPGEVISLPTIRHLVDLEAEIAHHIDPRMTPLQRANWEGRANVTDMLRPPKFNGSLVDITLEVMDNPYEQLRTVRERGQQVRHGIGQRILCSEALADPEGIYSTRGTKTVGLIFSAEASSSRRGLLGLIQSELYYFPAADKCALSGKVQRTGGSTVISVVADPIYETARFERANSESRAEALRNLRHNMRRARSTPLRN